MEFNVDQNIFNIGVSLIGALGGIILKAVWNAVKELQQADKDLTEKVHNLDKIVAGDYVRRDYLDGKIEALFRKIDGLYDQLNKKADK